MDFAAVPIQRLKRDGMFGFKRRAFKNARINDYMEEKGRKERMCSEPSANEVPALSVEISLLSTFLENRSAICAPPSRLTDPSAAVGAKKGMTSFGYV